jgi:hypothetical protein
VYEQPSSPLSLATELRPDALGSYTDDGYDLQGTVMRPIPGTLQELWKNGEGEHSVEHEILL